MENEIHKLDKSEIISLINNALDNNAETRKVEFKDARGGFSKQIWKSISAFSNTSPGGIIVFGVSENGESRELEVVGGIDLAQLQERVASFISDEMENCGKFSLKILSLKEKDLLCLAISETSKEKKPCYYREVGMPRGACVRKGNTDRVITDEEMKSFVRRSSEYQYDKEPVGVVSLDVFSQDKLDGFLDKSAERADRNFPNDMDKEGVLKNLGLITESQNRLVPTLAGVLIFSADDPQNIQDFSRYVIRCVSYKGNSPSTPIVDQQDVAGTLDEQIDKSLRFILRNIPLKAEIVGTKREDEYEYPQEVLREVLANAVIHRDYQITGTYVQVSVFDNRIEIVNPGTLPPGINIGNIKDSQFSRNKVVANTMRDLEYMEEFGRGINLVYSKMDEWGLAEPLFNNSANTFKVTLLGSDFKDLNERQVWVWYYLQDHDRITVSEAVNNYSELSRPTIYNDIKEMVDLDLLNKKGSSSNTYYEANY